MSAHIDGIFSSLRRTVEGRAILELTAHDLRVENGVNAGPLRKADVLARNLLEFITCKPMPQGGRCALSRGMELLKASDAGKKIVAKVDPSQMGLTAELGLLEQMASYVLQHGKGIVDANTSHQVNAVLPPIPRAQVLPPTPAVQTPVSIPASPAANSAAAFPESAAAAAGSGVIGSMTRARAAVMKCDLDAPKADAPAADHLKHYNALVLSGESMRAGLYWQRHSAKIREALDQQ